MHVHANVYTHIYVYCTYPCPGTYAQGGGRQRTEL